VFLCDGWNMSNAGVMSVPTIGLEGRGEEGRGEEGRRRGGEGGETMKEI